MECLFHNEVIRPQKLDSFLADIRQRMQSGFQPIAFFGTSESLIYCFLGKTHELCLYCTPFPDPARYPSLSVDYPAFQIFERELCEEFGILPIRHPWLKSVRHPSGNKLSIEDYPFLHSDSRLIHEVGVGPVHAGVIEPGHFRLLMRGEVVEHLEIQLGWQHRGIIPMFCKGPLASKMLYAEAISGDTVIGHGSAYCGIVEELSDITAPASDLRMILLEMERVAMHLSTLSALAGDVAYIMGQYLFAALRTTVINATLSICGSRFGKRALRPGGLNYGISTSLIKDLKAKMQYCSVQIHDAAEAMFANSSLISRFDDTGTISANDALSFGFTGITAKASGIPVDARMDHPVWQYPGFLVQTESSGDVYARAHLRYMESMQSLQIILNLLDKTDPEAPCYIGLKELMPNQIVVSIVEGARGRIVHIAKSMDTQKALWYRVVDPSIVNWQALSIAVSQEQISDFPLCNKSFDLSYCGSDL